MSLQTNGVFERFIATLTADRDNVEGVLRKRVYTLKTVEGTLHVVGLDFAPGERDGNKFLHTKINEVDIHLRDGLQPNADGVVSGRIEIKLRVWHKADGNGTCNYGFHMNVWPSTKPSECNVIIHDTEASDYQGREYAHMIDLDGNFAHVSNDKKRDQHIIIMDEAAYLRAPVRGARKPRRAKLTQPAA